MSSKMISNVIQGASYDLLVTEPLEPPSHFASKSSCLPAPPSQAGGMRGAFKFTSGRNEVRTKDGCFLRSPRPCLWKEWKGKEEERKGRNSRERKRKERNLIEEERKERNSRERKRKGRNLIPSGAFAYSTGLHKYSTVPH